MTLTKNELASRKQIKHDQPPRWADGRCVEPRAPGQAWFVRFWREFRPHAKPDCSACAPNRSGHASQLLRGKQWRRTAKGDNLRDHGPQRLTACADGEPRIRPTTAGPRWLLPPVQG